MAVCACMYINWIVPMLSSLWTTQKKNLPTGSDLENFILCVHSKIIVIVVHWRERTQKMKKKKKKIAQKTCQTNTDECSMEARVYIVDLKEEANKKRKMKCIENPNETPFKWQKQWNFLFQKICVRNSCTKKFIWIRRDFLRQK